MKIHSEEQLASLIAAGGIIWGVRIISAGLSSMPAVSLPPGPLELSLLGVAMWLHAKWRRSIRAS